MAQSSARTLPIGSRVTSIPVVRQQASHAVIGQSSDFPGGFGEYMLVDENMMMAIPDGVDDDLVAMVEPFAVGLEHARSGEPTTEDTVLVVGCGAIGLGVIAGLKLRGIGPIIASDYDPARRELAVRMGADAVVDPAQASPFQPQPGISSVAPTLIYECVGAPGMLSQLMRSAAFGARIVVGGFCLEPEQIYVPNGQMKRLKILFAAGEEPQDMQLALSSIASGKVDIGSWIGARIGLDCVGAALTGMRESGAPVRTVVDPRRLVWKGEIMSDLETLLAEREINQQLLAYCRAMDRCDAELGLSVFHADAVLDYGDIYRGDAQGFIDFTMTAHAHLDAHLHRISNITFSVNSDRAGSETYVDAVLVMTSDGALLELRTAGRYVDEWQKRAGRWAISRRQYLHVTNGVRPLEPGSMPITGSRDRSDPSYVALGS